MNQMTRRGVVALSLVGLCGLAYLAWSANRGAAPAAAQPAAAPGPVVVEAASVAAFDFADETSAVGTLKAGESVVLRPEVSGRVVGIGFKDGAVVGKGDLLVAFDATIQDAEVAQARANVELARSTYRRNQELLEKKFISPQALDASGATLKVQEAALQLAVAKAEKMRIRAPFRGVVGLRSVSVGSYVKEGEELINLEEIGSLRVDFRLAEIYFGRLQKGQALEMTSDAQPGKRFAAIVEAIDPQIDPNGRSIAVRARFDNAAGELRPGMFVRVRLAFGERKGVLMVPEEAVIPGGQPAVFQVVDGKAVRTPVRLGMRRDARVEITEGLKLGDVVVSAGQLKLKPGAPVRVQQATQAKP